MQFYPLQARHPAVNRSLPTLSRDRIKRYSGCIRSVREPQTAGMPIRMRIRILPRSPGPLCSTYTPGPLAAASIHSFHNLNGYSDVCTGFCVLTCPEDLIMYQPLVYKLRVPVCRQSRFYGIVLVYLTLRVQS